MQMFQIRHTDGSKDTVIVPKILGISEKDNEINISFDNGMKQTVKTTDKIIDFEWATSRMHDGFDRVEKEIPFEEFHDWLIEQIAEYRYS